MVEPRSQATDGWATDMSIKRILRSLLETPLFSGVRLLLWRREAKRERLRVRHVASQMGLPVVSWPVLEEIQSQKPHATTAFILGTGASAAAITPAQWDYVSTQFAIGVNRWIFHPFIPDVYAYEAHPDVTEVAVLDREEVRERNPSILFLKPSSVENYGSADAVPGFLKTRTFLYGRVNIVTRKTGNIGQDSVTAVDSLTRAKQADILLDNGASIARMIILCSVLGFKKIVLIGVDLNTTRYFWDDDPNVLERLGIRDLPSVQSGAKHETLSATSRPFAIDLFVQEVQGSLSGDGGALEVASPKSLLVSHLPCYQWPE